MPLLGEGNSVQLQKIHEHVSPDEICPILPFPGRDPRRGDGLIQEYRELLFDQWLVEPGNFIHAAEQNPFSMYRQTMRSAQDYIRALEPLGGCRIAISLLSSKLLSVGALLAAFELIEKGHHAGVAHIGSQRYTIDSNHQPSAQGGEMFTMALSGDFYET